MTRGLLDLTNMKKVLLVSPYSAKDIGGIGTWTKIMLDYCKDRDDVQLCFQNTASRLPKSKSNKYLISHIVIGVLDSVSILMRLFCNMVRHKPDIVHYTSSAAFALNKDRIACFIVRQLFRKQFVIHWRFGRIPEIIESKSKECHGLIKVVKAASASIVIDKRSYFSLQKIGALNVFNLPNPISIALQNESESLNVVRLQQEREMGTVLFVGHVIRTKGIVELVKACAECSDVKKLVVIGSCIDESLKKELNIIAAKRDDGQWLKWEGVVMREKVFDYYRKCNIFCLPSYTEGFPNTVIEALANAAPTIATNVGAIPEILADSCGICIPSRDIGALKDAITTALSNATKSIKMGINGREKVLKEYTIDEVYQGYQGIWDNVLVKQEKQMSQSKN